MAMFYHLLCLAVLAVAVRSEEHLYAHGPFRKSHLTIEKPNRIHCAHSDDIFDRFVHPLSLTIAELQVSATTYSKSDRIHVSWKPSPVQCQDDFIGVYFVETPKTTGKNSTGI